MKHFFRQIGIVGIFLFSLIFCAYIKDREQLSSFQLQFQVGDETILSWHDGGEMLYVFLPSYCDMREVSFKKELGQQVKIDDIALKDDMTMEEFEIDYVYNIALRDYRGKIQFCKSDHVATLFIDTESGNMDAIHQTKGYREDAKMRLVRSDGSNDYSTDACSLKGRGNTTWDLFEKKPYQLKLEEAANLLGMGTGKKWILLANAFDETNLRNKVIYDLARVNAFCMAPECEYVDLYLNGEYRGLYLLTERVEFGEERLNLRTEDGAFMCNIEYAQRWDTLDNAFMTELGRAVEIREPDEPTHLDYTNIKSEVQKLEDFIVSKEDVKLSSVIDVDSWVYKYLFDEISENGDADIASSYFYYKDGLFYAGPLWDYDNTLGVSTRNQNPHAFLARSTIKSANNQTPYYDALYENDEFYQRMTELYRTQVAPAFMHLIEEDLFEREAFLQYASTMNGIRWASAFEEQNAVVEDAKDLADYLRQRIEFLNRVWIEGEDYCVVQFEAYAIDMFATENTYATSYVVKCGERFSNIAVPQITENKNFTWVNSETGEIFSPDQIITENITLSLYRTLN